MSRRGKGLRDDQIRDIFRLLFGGYSISETAGLVDVSAPTVRNYLNRLVSEAERGGLLSTARSYGVEGKVKDLMSVSKELNESGLEPEECVAGSRVVKILRDLGVNETKFVDFVHSAYTEAVGQGLKPREFASSC